MCSPRLRASVSRSSVCPSLAALSVACMLWATPAIAQAPRVTPALDTLSKAFEDLSRRVSPSVVQVVVTGYGTPEEEAPSADALLGLRRTGGSGVILDANGYIITNSHVIEGARRVQVVLPRPTPGAGNSILRPRGTALDAKIVGIDDETDLAVLKIEEKNLPALPLGDSDSLRQGQLVLAYGSPLGLENSVSMGIVSAVGRQLEIDDPMVYIQTDAPINPGNSGGPLVDTDGRVVGINTLILSQSGGNEGLGFAAPSNIVRTVFDQIKAGGRVRRGTIGVLAQTITPTLATAMKLPQDWGVILGDVFPNTPAAVAGLRIGDVVVSLDGKRMENGRQFEVNLYRRAVGDTVMLEVFRGGQPMKFPVAVAEREDDPARFAEMVSPERNIVPRLGVLALDIDERVASMLGELRVPHGVLVAAISADSPSADQKLEAGDVIVSFNGKPITALAELRSAVGRLPTRTAVFLQIQRHGQLMFVAIEVD
jgi:serine protease Do